MKKSKTNCKYNSNKICKCDFSSNYKKICVGENTCPEYHQIKTVIIKQNPQNSRAIINKEGVSSLETITLDLGYEKNNSVESVITIEDDNKIIDNENNSENSDTQKYIKDVHSIPSTILIKSIIDQWNEGDLIIPTFQRKFVWKIEQASKFIDSLMSNIPFPAIMLYQDINNKFHIIDGQQRIKSILYFTGNFQKDSIDPLDKKYVNFRLKGLSKDSPYFDKTFNGDNCFTEDEKRALRSKSIPITVITVDNPKDLSSIYSIFERLNSGGTPLTAQEIRNCICQGKFNDFLFDLNKNEKWQSFITSSYDHIHQKDIELILRFFALYDDMFLYKKPMKDFLTTYFKKVSDISDTEIEEKRNLFNNVVDAIYDNIGERPFHGKNGLNSSFVDSIMLAFADNLDNIPKDIKSRWFNLINNNKEFYSYVNKSSDSIKDLSSRIDLARNKLFDEVGEQEEKIIKLFELTVSAGTGNWLGDENLNYKEITTTNRRADFALRISGDSMSPDINDGDIVLVKSQPMVLSGRTGIFTYKNKSYCKKLLKSKALYLISNNKKYKAIKIEDEDQFYINGLVVDILPKDMFSV